MNCVTETAEFRSLQLSRQRSDRFSDLLKASVGRRAGRWGESNLRAIHTRLIAAHSVNQSADQPVALEVSLEEAFDLVQSLAASMNESNWTEEDQDVYDDLLAQLARDPFSCCAD